MRIGVERVMAEISESIDMREERGSVVDETNRTLGLMFTNYWIEARCVDATGASLSEDEYSEMQDAVIKRMALHRFCDHPMVVMDEPGKCLIWFGMRQPGHVDLPMAVMNAEDIIVEIFPEGETWDILKLSIQTYDDQETLDALRARTQ